MTNLKYFAKKKSKKHEQGKSHMDNAVLLGMFGRVNIAAHLTEVIKRQLQ